MINLVRSCGKRQKPQHTPFSKASISSSLSTAALEDMLMFKGHQIRPVKANGSLLLSLCTVSGLSVLIKLIICIYFFHLDLFMKRTKPQKAFFNNDNKSPKEDKKAFNCANLMPSQHFLLRCHFMTCLEENMFSNCKINSVGKKKKETIRFF